MKYLPLVIIYIIAESFFNLLDIKTDPKDIITVFLAVLLLINIRKISLKNIKKYSVLYIFLFACFILSVITGTANYLFQTISYSVIASRIFILYILFLLYFSNCFDVSSLDYKKFHTAFLSAAFILICINYYLFITKDFESFSNLYITKRFGEDRFMIAGDSVILLTIYFLVHRNEKVVNFVVLALLLSVLIFISKTRAIFIPITFILAYDFLFAKRGMSAKNRLRNRAIFVCLIAAVLYFSTSSISSAISDMVNLTVYEVADNSGNYQVRAEGLAYYTSFLNPTSILWGRGIESLRVTNIYIEKYTLADLGIFKIFYYHGVFCFILYAALLWLIYKKSEHLSLGLFKYSRYLVAFLVLSCLTLTNLYALPSFFAFIVLYVIVNENYLQSGY